MKFILALVFSLGLSAHAAPVVQCVINDSNDSLEFRQYVGGIFVLDIGSGESRIEKAVTGGHRLVKVLASREKVSTFGFDAKSCEYEQKVYRSETGRFQAYDTLHACQTPDAAKSILIWSGFDGKSDLGIYLEIYKEADQIKSPGLSLEKCQLI